LEVEAEAGSRAGEEAEAKTKPLRLSVAYVALDYFLEWVLGATARSVLKEPVVVLAQTITRFHCHRLSLVGDLLPPHRSYPLVLHLPTLDRRLKASELLAPVSTDR